MGGVKGCHDVMLHLQKKRVNTAFKVRRFIHATAKLSTLELFSGDRRCITMSLTLHTTEIWLNTRTDSGGMKDRTHGIFLQEDSGRESANTTLCGSQCRSGFPVILNGAEGPLGLRDG